MQDNRNALKQTIPGTEIQVSLETCKNLAFEWGVCTTSPTCFFPLLKLENWRSELWCVNNSHPFWHPAFQITFENKETPVFLGFYLLCYQQAFKLDACLVDKWYIEKTESHKVDSHTFGLWWGWAIEKRTIRNCRCFSWSLVNADHYSNVTFLQYFAKDRNRQMQIIIGSSLQL